MWNIRGKRYIQQKWLNSDGGGAQEYIKTGKWNGNDVTYSIYRISDIYTWFIGYIGGGDLSRTSLYFSPTRMDLDLIPPEGGWSSSVAEFGPAPKCRLLINSNSFRQSGSNCGNNATSTIERAGISTQSPTSYTYETVKLSFEPGRKLGFVLVDSLCNNQEMRPNSNNRTVTATAISNLSIIFQFADGLLNAANQRVPAFVDPPNQDELIEWGRKELPPLLQFRNGSVSFDSMNRESLKYVLDYKVQGGDIVEKVSCPKFTAPWHDKSAKDLGCVLRDLKNYPMSITFKRPIVNEIVVEGAGRKEFNGTYKRDGERKNAFSKKGQWQGGTETFLLAQYGSSWKISIPSNGTPYYWTTPTPRPMDTPPATGWLANMLIIQLLLSAFEASL